MAYIYKGTDGKWHGPYPNKVGDFCGNHNPTATKSSWDEPDDGHLLNKRFGRPSSCGLGSSAKMQQDGFVGLYLDRDVPTLQPSSVDIDTDVLTEEVVTGDRQPEKPFDLDDWVAKHPA